MELLGEPHGAGTAIRESSITGDPRSPDIWATPGELSALQVEQSRGPLCGAAACSIDKARSARRIAAHHRVQPSRIVGCILRSLFSRTGIVPDAGEGVKAPGGILTGRPPGAGGRSG